MSGGGVGEGDDVGVGDVNSERDTGVGESLKDLRIAVEELDRGEGSLRSEEMGDSGRRREVIGDSAKVDAGEGGSGGGKEEREKGEEVEWEDMIRHDWLRREIK